MGCGEGWGLLWVYKKTFPQLLKIKPVSFLQ